MVLDRCLKTNSINTNVMILWWDEEYYGCYLYVLYVEINIQCFGKIALRHVYENFSKISNFGKVGSKMLVISFGVQVNNCSLFSGVNKCLTLSATLSPESG
jgi:hypothetical protein